MEDERLALKCLLFISLTDAAPQFLYLNAYFVHLITRHLAALQKTEKKCEKIFASREARIFCDVTVLDDLGTRKHKHWNTVSDYNALEELS